MLGTVATDEKSDSHSTHQEVILDSFLHVTLGIQEGGRALQQVHPRAGPLVVPPGGCSRHVRHNSVSITCRYVNNQGQTRCLVGYQVGHWCVGHSQHYWPRTGPVQLNAPEAAFRNTGRVGSSQQASRHHKWALHDRQQARQTQKSLLRRKPHPLDGRIQTGHLLLQPKGQLAAVQQAVQGSTCKSECMGSTRQYKKKRDQRLQGEGCVYYRQYGAGGYGQPKCDISKWFV